MEYGHLEGHIREKNTVMETVYYVGQRMLELIIHGGNVERLTINQISVSSNLFKLCIKNRINLNVSGTQE
eukprot:4442880-Heterocapsa_arctica.AAC.1